METTLNLNKVEKKALSVIEGAKQAAKITDDTGYQFCLEYLSDVKRSVKVWCDIHEKSRESAYNTYQEIMIVINKIKKPGDEAVKKILEPALNKWERDREAKRLADEAKLTKIAKEQKIDDVPFVLPSAPGIAGIEKRTKPEIVVDDLMALVAAVAAGKAPVEFILPNISAMTKRMNEIGDAFKVPGVSIQRRSIYALNGRG